MKQEYELHIETDKYAGNFERKMCAFLTGVVGDCEVGDKEKYLYQEEESYEFELRQVADDNCTQRPVTISGKEYKSLTIFLNKPLDEEGVEIIKRRLPIFAEKNKLTIKSVKEIVKTIEYKENRILL